MFTYLSRLLGRLTEKPFPKLLLAALVVLVAAVLLGSVVRWLRRRRQDDPRSWSVLGVSAVGAVLKALVGLAVLAGLCLSLSFQAQEFSRRHGGLSQRNYEAVKTIWGRPHVQRELNVKLATYATHYYDKDGLELDLAKIQASSTPIAYRKTDVENIIPVNPLISAQHQIDITMNYRRKGLGVYPGFETTSAFNYKVANLGEESATALFSFPLPTDQGMVDRIAVTMDGQPVTRDLVADGVSLTWKRSMQPAQECKVTVSYHSRGLDHLRFEPGTRQLRQYQVSMVLHGIPKKDVDYPIGCMTETDSHQDGDDTTLIWNLDNAVTRLGMGVILPGQQREGYHLSGVLEAAPLGLVLLLGMVVVTGLLLGGNLHWLGLLLLAVAYYLYNLLTAYLGDYWPGMAGGMLLSGLALTALTAALQLKINARLAAWTNVGFFVLFCVAYPLIRISEYSGLLLTVLYVLLLAYVTVIVILRWRGSRENAG
jgi:hypothetical protein